MTPHQQSLTHKYIKGETLLRAKPRQVGAGSPTEFEIWRGAKMIAKVIRRQGDVVISWGQVNLENAKDAIFIHDLESAQRERERLEARKAKADIQAVEAQKIRPVAVPQVIVTLAPDGALQVELPGVGTRRVIKLRDDSAVFSLKEILAGQRSGEIAIGQDGAPTRQQVWHWENHSQFPDARCAHCISEGRINGTPKRQRRSELISKTKDVEIRRLAPQVKRTRGQAAVTSTSRLNAEDLGL